MSATRQRSLIDVQPDDEDGELRRAIHQLLVGASLDSALPASTRRRAGLELELPPELANAQGDDERAERPR
jgi:hypothetical protein